jgi:predicted DNA-binding transcriptional regulator YafY
MRGTEQLEQARLVLMQHRLDRIEDAQFLIEQHADTLTDRQLAGRVGVSMRTIQRYRAALRRIGMPLRERRLWL